MKIFRLKYFIVVVLAILLSQIGCEEDKSLPIINTSQVTSIEANQANSGGTVIDEGGSPVSVRGVCWSTLQNPTINDFKTTDGIGKGSFVSIITELSPGVTYHVRAYATNSFGTSYGEDIVFTTISSLPSVTTLPLTSITSNSAVGGGDVTDDGGSAVIVRGVCWSTSENPTISNFSTNDGEGEGVYSSSIVELSPGTTYHVRAYATNDIGTSYGDNISFSTTPRLPSITTIPASQVTENTAVSGGIISFDGGSNVTSRGVCWSLTPNPTTSDHFTVDGAGVGEFSSNIDGLAVYTTYFVRAYAVNEMGTAYGNNESFTTTSSFPTVTTAPLTSITETTAIGGGNVISDGGMSVTSRGICWSISPNPTTENITVYGGSGTGIFECLMEGLSPEGTYHVRAFATNSYGTVYGEDIEFTTLADLPDVPDNDHMLLGNPSSATTSVSNANNYLMLKPQYCLSYSNSKLTANWASWHLYLGDIGDVERQDDFRADNTLPTDWYWVTGTSYSGSGFDRGHLCPSADRTLTIPDNSATFLMTNMIPQAPNNNRITWANLEQYCRDLLDVGNELFIIAGPYGQGGSGSNGFATTIGNEITVPNKTWKIIVVIPNGDNDLSRINTSTRVIAVVMPNDQTCNSQPWEYYRVSVNSIETLTGYDFLSNIPVSIQEVIEGNVDSVTID